VRARASPLARPGVPRSMRGQRGILRAPAGAFRDARHLRRLAFGGYRLYSRLSGGRPFGEGHHVRFWDFRFLRTHLFLNGVCVIDDARGYFGLPNDVMTRAFRGRGRAAHPARHGRTATPDPGLLGLWPRGRSHTLSGLQPPPARVGAALLHIPDWSGCTNLLRRFAPPEPRRCRIDRSDEPTPSEIESRRRRQEAQHPQKKGSGRAAAGRSDYACGQRRRLSCPTRRSNSAMRWRRAAFSACSWARVAAVSRSRRTRQRAMRHREEQTRSGRRPRQGAAADRAQTGV
jgi:hypothetical protein